MFAWYIESKFDSIKQFFADNTALKTTKTYTNVAPKICLCFSKTPKILFHIKNALNILY